jgi:hypothetical protein
MLILKKYLNQDGQDMQDFQDFFYQEIFLRAGYILQFLKIIGT